MKDICLYSAVCSFLIMIPLIFEGGAYVVET